MKKSAVLWIFSLMVSTGVLAQISTTPEVPRNYKPTAKALLPMPDSLTEAAIFPVLGHYNVTNVKNEAYSIQIVKDEENKGIIWIEGLPQGQIKANLQQFPGTYKIMPQIPQANPQADNQGSAQKKPSKKTGVKPISTGTLIFDQAANKLYINIGGNYDEKQPDKIFNHLANEDSTQNESPVATKKTLKATRVGIYYSGSKTE